MNESMLDEYIHLCDEFLASDHDPKAAALLIKRICAAFGEVVPGFANQITYFAPSFNAKMTCQEYCDDILMLRDKLMAYKEIREYDLEMAKCKSPSVRMSQVQNVDIDIAALYNNTARAVFEIDDDVLDMDQKAGLMYLLADLKNTVDKPKETKGEAARKVLEWLGDKATDVLIAVIPYISAVLQSA